MSSVRDFIRKLISFSLDIMEKFILKPLKWVVLFSDLAQLGYWENLNITQSPKPGKLDKETKKRCKNETNIITS